jgi:hypothetical protein
MWRCKLPDDQLLDLEIVSIVSVRVCGSGDGSCGGLTGCGLLRA